MTDPYLNIALRTLDNLSTAVLFFDDQPHLYYLNTAAEMLLAISKRHAVGLTRNAAQALGKQGNIILRTRVARQFTIAGRRHRLVLRIDIVDDGAGIPEELAPYIFLPMVTGRADGVGLGLSIAQSLITQNGGFIEFVSQPGETIFSLILPINHSKNTEETIFSHVADQLLRK